MPVKRITADRPANDDSPEIYEFRFQFDNAQQYDDFTKYVAGSGIADQFVSYPGDHKQSIVYVCANPELFVNLVAYGTVRNCLRSAKYIARRKSLPSP